MTKSQTEWWAPVERSDEVSDLFSGDTRVAPVESKTSRSRGRAKQQRERKRRRRRSIWVLIVAILMVAGAAYVAHSLISLLLDGPRIILYERLTMLARAAGEFPIILWLLIKGADVRRAGSTP